jgi:hypothetical protein
MNRDFSFKTWLSEQELQQEVSLSGIGKSLKKAIMPIAAAGAMAIGGHDVNVPDSPQPPQNSFYVSAPNQLDKIASAINAKYKTQIRASQIQMIKPIDVIKPVYGDNWNSVYQTAKQAQGDLETPTYNSSAVTDLSKLDKEVPVIFDDPSVFGQTNVNGFCTSIVVDNRMQKFCVVKNKEMLHTIRHESSHATQDTMVKSSLGGSGQFGSYFMDEAELGVRIGEMKRNYYALTGNLVTSDDKSLLAMLKHFLTNHKSYSPDVQQMKATIEKSSQERLLPRLIEFIKDNIDKIVQNSPGTRTYA